MPRGVYDRKPKGEKTAAPAKKAAPTVKTAPKTAAKSSLKADKPEAPTFAGQQVARSTTVDAVYGFQILGTNLTTLVSALKELGDLHVDLKVLGIAQEIKGTLDTMTALRHEVFGDHRTDLVAAAAIAEKRDVKIEKHAAPANPALPTIVAPADAPPVVNSPTVLPQGNAAFTPPAPPALPQH